MFISRLRLPFLLDFIYDSVKVSWVKLVDDCEQIVAVHVPFRMLFKVRQVRTHVGYVVYFVENVFHGDMLKLLNVEVGNIVIAEVLLLASQNVAQEFDWALSIRRYKQLTCNSYGAG